MIAGSLAAFLIFGFLSFAAGSLTAFIWDRREDPLVRIPVRLATGGCLVILCAALVCLLGALAGLPVKAALVMIGAALAILCTTGFVAGRKREKRGKALRLKVPGAVDTILVIVAIGLFVVQVYTGTAYSFDAAMALKPISTATRVYDSGRLFTGDPMMILAGTISKAIGIHPLLFVYNISCLPLLAFYNICYVAVINTFLKGRSRLVAFITVELTFIMGYQSKAWPVTLLVTWYSIWVFVIHGLANTMVAYFAGWEGAEKEDGRVIPCEDEDDTAEEWDMKKHRIVNARNLAIAIGVLAAALMILVFVLNSKINRLYEVTVALQEDLDKRCGLYEFTDPDGRIAGYLLKGSDGTMSFVGGGPSDNADELAAFLEKHGEKVNNWYVYGDDEENAGAMRSLISSGLADAEKVYVIDRKEITGIR